MLDDGSPSLIFDAVVVVAALEADDLDFDAARTALDLLSITRTPLTMAALLRVAAGVEFDLGLDRFLESFEPQKLAARGDRAAAFLTQQHAILVDA